MTRRQMLARFRKLGGKTKLNAVLITIEKYGPKGRLKLTRSGPHRPNCKTCALCELWLRDATKRSSKKNCWGCPLNSWELRCDNNFTPRDPWRAIMAALVNPFRNEERLNRDCDRIVNAMTKWLRKHHPEAQ